MDDEALSFIANKSRSTVEWWARSFARVVPIEGSVVLARVLGGYLMYVDMRDRSLAPHLAGSGFWEMWITQAIARYVKRGMRCIDVGANFGYYTMLLSDIVGANGNVVALEPITRLVDLARRSVDVNGFSKHCAVFELAAGAQSERLEFFIPSDEHLGSTSSKLGATLGVGKVCQVERLDKLLDRVDMPFDFIKIDSEGMEPEVWEGMSGIIKRSPKLVVAMEWSPGAYTDPGEFLRRIETEGFRVEKIDDNGQIVMVDKGKLVDKSADWAMLWLSHV